MDLLKEFNRIMENSDRIALATVNNDTPNVRIMNFYYDSENKGIVYVPAFKESSRAKEFFQKSKVAFTTIPAQSNESVRVTNATVKKSNLTPYEIKDGIARNFLSFAALIEQAGSKIEVYEIHFKDAIVSFGYDQNGTVAFIS